MRTIYKNKTDLLDNVIGSGDSVLDVGFWGQAVVSDEEHWPHKLLLDRAREVYGVDIVYDKDQVTPTDHYLEASAEDFSFEKQFDVIFAGDLIEHISNPGLFLNTCKRHAHDGTRLILTTPNTFNLFSVFAKILRDEPPTNPDHTFYFNHVVLSKLLEKNGWKTKSIAYINSFPTQMNVKRWIVFGLYRFIQFFTPKYCETLVIVAKQV